VKTCSRCKTSKPYDAFSKDAGKSDGLAIHCKVCRAEYRAAHKQEISEYNHKYRIENIERRKQYMDEYRAANKEQIQKQRRGYHQKYYADNADTLKRNVIQYAKNNRGRVNALCLKRHADKLKRTPAWADHERSTAYYDVCAFFNEVNGYTKYHVDHIIPLRGRKVSGLHVHNNLQVILASENASKGNHFEVL